MSTKIYNGYVLPNMNLLELNAFGKNLGIAIRKIKEDEVCKELARLMIHKFDEKTLNPDQQSKKESYLFKAWDDMQSVANKAKGSSSNDYSFWDYSSSVVFIPLNDKILALFYSYYAGRKFKNYWESLTEVKDYHYQDQSDSPEDVSEADLNQRKLDWDLALPDSSPVPTHNGLVFELSDHDIPHIDFSKIKSQFPSLAMRAKSQFNSLDKDQKKNTTIEEIQAKLKVDVTFDDLS
jgi:hypothetical protein